MTTYQDPRPHCPMQHHKPEPYGPDEEPEVRGLCRYDLAAPESHHAPHEPEPSPCASCGFVPDAAGCLCDPSHVGTPTRADHRTTHDATCGWDGRPDSCRACRPDDYPPHDPDAAARTAARMLARLETMAPTPQIHALADRLREYLPVSPWARRALSHTLPPLAHGARAYTATR